MIVTFLLNGRVREPSRAQDASSRRPGQASHTRLSLSEQSSLEGGTPDPREHTLTAPPSALHLSVALDGAGWHPAAWREPRARPGELFTARYWTNVVTEAERGLLNLVTIEDGLGLQSDRYGEPDARTNRVRGRLDAVLIAARAAPVTRHIGLVPAVVVTHTEPFHASKAIATLDYVSSGRAGVRVRVSSSPHEAALFGRRDVPALNLRDRGDPAARQFAAGLFGEAADYVEVIRRLWDSWEDGAEIRDAATGRFIDREKLHYIDFAGDYFSVKGPSITPRPPQGQPVVAALGHGPGPDRLIGQSADVGFVTPQDAGQARDMVAEIRSAQAEAGRAAEKLHVFADLVVFLAEDGGTAAARQAAARRPRRGGVPQRRGRLHRDTRAAGGPAAGVAARRAVGLPAAPRRHPGRPRGDHPGTGARTAAPRCLPLSLRGQYPAGAARPQPAGEPLRPSREELIMTTARKQIHLAAHFPGVNNTTVWSDPRSGSHIEFSSFAHLARTAERAKFDFLFLAEGLRLREQNGLIYDLDVVGRPDTFTVLAALAAVTDRLGLAGTISSTFNEPYEVARQFASLDHLSGGRAAWNVVTSWDAFTGENFRRGGFLPQEARYERARTFLQTAWELFDSWRGDEVVADKVSGVFLADAGAGEFAHADAHFGISGQFSVPRSPQGRPVIFQAGDSADGREFAASSADAIFSRHGTLEDGQAFYADVKGRLARYGRSPDQLLILPAATFVLGDTDAAARELAREVRFQQVSGQTAIRFLEQVWNRDLSGYDPDGPLPRSTRTQGRTPSPAAGPACECTGTRSPSRRSGGPGRRRGTCRSAS